ncbi:hypothetical protein [uncultured Erythrobacter sp.]|uniref:hypothetical protein n=1 Tax=uncultured Erythrobacter sp. TaxID=263913 RepID=UPI002633BC83|nr:hypothetical protein [uncultured Erythrobacter sp.]
MLTFFYPIALLQATATPAETAATPPPAPPPPCESEAHAGFDLWVGEWNVFPNGSDAQVANSGIEKLSGGCTIREQWMPFQGAGGISLSAVNHNSGRWEQTWVGSDGKRVDFEGGVVDGKMVLMGYWDDIGGPGVDALVRMTYSREEDGSVRQHGEASTDHGLSWQTSFDLIYRPKENDTP